MSGSPTPSGFSTLAGCQELVCFEPEAMNPGIGIAGSWLTGFRLEPARSLRAFVSSWLTLGRILPDGACGSLYEVVTQMKIANNEDFLAKADYDHMYKEAEEISRMLSGLRRSLRH